MTLSKSDYFPRPHLQISLLKNKQQTKKAKTKTVAPEFTETENRGRELGVGETGKDGRCSNDANFHL